MKQCTRCGNQKEDCEFPVGRSGKPRSPCKSCKNEYTKAWREANPNYYEDNKEVYQERDLARRLTKNPDKSLKNKQWYEANKEDQRAKAKAKYEDRRAIVLANYGPTCKCCNESLTEFLTIDHIDGGGNQHRKTLPSNDIYRYLINRGFPTGYRVLCMNCNGSLGWRGYCPHGNL